MNKFYTYMIVLVSVLTMSFNVTSVLGQVPVKESKFTWEGFKVGSSHKGSIKLKSGHVEMTSEKITGGKFVMDMGSITCTDLEGEWATKLNDHLKSDDFFSVKKHPTSELVFTEVKHIGGNKHEVKANLTIKGITKPISFQLLRNLNKYTSLIKIDRTEYGIEYSSGSFFESLGDKLIYDEFEISVEVSL